MSDFILNRKIVRNSLLFVFWLTAVLIFSVSAQNIFPKNTYLLPKDKDILLAPSSKACDDISWSTSNPRVASVDSFGVVHAVSRGKAEITAINNNSREVSKCCVEVEECDPIRTAFTSSNMAGIDAPFDLKALTNKNVEAVRFEIRGDNYNQDVYCSNKSNCDNFNLWSQNIKLPHAGNYSINAYAKTKQSWTTCPEASTGIFIVNGFNKSDLSLSEKRVSSEGADFIASCEGFRSKVYKDPAGLLTIGYGKRIYPYEPFYNNLSKTEGVALFSKTLNRSSYTRSVNKFLISNKIKFNQRQFDALVSFSYNVGCDWIFSGSDLSNILLRCHSKGTYLQGIVNSDNGLFVRSSPNTQSKKLKVLYNLSRVDILSPNKENESWYLVRTADGVTGYCCGDYLKVNTIKSGEKSLNHIDKNEFISEFSLYHHLCKKCFKGLLARRFHELDIFLHGVYSKFRSKHFSYGDYPIPECAKNAV